MFAWNSRKPLFLSIFTAILYGVLWNTPRENSFVLVLVFFGCCSLSFRLVKQSTLQHIFILGLGFRLLFIGIIPWLSQDIYRFIWDGLLFYNHINPYAYTPNALMESDVLFQSALKEELWQNMGALSAGHYSNYPPINQLGFLLSVFGVSENLLISVVCMRLLLIAADIGIFFIGKQLLKVLHLPEKRIGWYFLNPLVIVELTANLHWEGVMIFFFVLGWWFYLKQQHTKAAFVFALSVATKLIPMLILPVLLRFQSVKKTVYMGLIGGGSLFLLFFPFFYEIGLDNYFATIRLWFKNFEFNGSFYYLVRWIGFQIKGYNIIRQWGEISPYLVLLMMGAFSLWKKKKDPKEVFTAMLLLLSCYYFMASIVHPWYVIPVLFLSLFTQFSYAVFWSAAVFLSYTTYGHPSFEENYLLLFLEYALVFGILILELKTRRPLLQHF